MHVLAMLRVLVAVNVTLREFQCSAMDQMCDSLLTVSHGSRQQCFYPDDICATSVAVFTSF